MITPAEAEQIMKPFYPHDPNLAKRALLSALQQEKMVPDWVVEAVVGAYFNFSEQREVETSIDESIRKTIDSDPFGLGTIPYNTKDYKIGNN